MKTLRLCLAFALLFSVTVARAQMSALNLNENLNSRVQRSSEEQVVSQLKRELAKAYVQGDVGNSLYLSYSPVPCDRCDREVSRDLSADPGTIFGQSLTNHQ